MNRKEFITSHGATCKNWTWSWSFINEKEKKIIFGAWDSQTKGNISLILAKRWGISSIGRKQPAYPQSREHIRLIEENGYKLFTFPIKYSDGRKDKKGLGPATIEDFEPILTEKKLIKLDDNWYASDNEFTDLIAEEVPNHEKFLEGSTKKIYINTYERNSDARKKCLDHFGYKCIVCSFDFEKMYGAIGENFIHVHHIIPISELKKEYELNPIKDLVPVCPNCHAIIHRTKPILTIEELKKHIYIRNT